MTATADLNASIGPPGSRVVDRALLRAGGRGVLPVVALDLPDPCEYRPGHVIGGARSLEQPQVFGWDTRV
jgi:hypothetical protein